MNVATFIQQLMNELVWCGEAGPDAASWDEAEIFMVNPDYSVSLVRSISYDSAEHAFVIE